VVLRNRSLVLTGTLTPLILPANNLSLERVSAGEGSSPLLCRMGLGDCKCLTAMEAEGANSVSLLTGLLLDPSRGRLPFLLFLCFFFFCLHLSFLLHRLLVSIRR